MKMGGLQVHASGVVRVMHDDTGMGVAFIQKTPEQRQDVENFIHALMNSKGAVPELLVEADGLELFGEETAVFEAADSEDPLLQLFETKAHAAAEEFLEELRRQRSSATVEDPVNP
jgi:hypothetical protein